MNHTPINCTPLESAACRLLVAVMRANQRPGASVRFDYQHHGPRLGAAIYTRIDRADLRGPAHQLSTVRHTQADINQRAAEIEALAPQPETTSCV